MIVDHAVAAGVGLALGVVTGLPLGVVNVAIVELAARDRRAALGVGLGGALADTVHAGLAFGGIAAAVLDRPRLAAVLALATGLVLVAYAVVLVRGRGPAVTSGKRTATGLARGVVLGASLTLPNPGALAAWVAVAAALAPPSTAQGLVTAAGVGVGSAAWFATLAVVAARGQADGVRRPWLRLVVAALLLLIGGAAIARGAWGLR